jgi:hypothetical protein
MTITSLFLKKAPSHTAQAEIPLFQYVSDPSNTSFLATAPVAIITAVALAIVFLV